MPPFQAVRPEHVLLALEEFDRVGADEFLSRYGFDHQGVFELLHNSSSYDSLAVLGVAHLRATGELAPQSDLSGGAEGAAEVLRGLGFTVDGEPAEEPDQGDKPIDASELGDEAARSAWAGAAREVLLETARKYHTVITSKELAAAVMSRSKITTKRPSTTGSATFSGGSRPTVQSGESRCSRRCASTRTEVWVPATAPVWWLPVERSTATPMTTPPANDSSATASSAPTCRRVEAPGPSRRG